MARCFLVQSVGEDMTCLKKFIHAWSWTEKNDCKHVGANLNGSWKASWSVKTCFFVSPFWKNIDVDKKNNLPSENWHFIPLQIPIQTVPKYIFLEFTFTLSIERIQGWQQWFHIHKWQIVAVRENVNFHRAAIQYVYMKQSYHPNIPLQFLSILVEPIDKTHNISRNHGSRNRHKDSESESL